jgi:16S rRNA (adenine1518-N6/adenine1519-N6)-dimethyltransferase
VIVANLPYNISTVLLLRWLHDIYHDPMSYERLILMFQKEVATRIVAKPHNKDYGRLSVMTQWLGTARIVFDLPPHVFVPPPKVTSSIVEIIPRRDRTDKVVWEKIESVLAAGFNQRRKMIRSSLSNYHIYLDRAGIDQTLRAENLTVDDYIRIAEAMNN